LTSTKRDIETRADIEKLVNSFYAKVQADTLLAPVFSHVDWPKHLPLMFDFWSLTLLGEPGYRNNMVQKHLNLPIKPEHFTQWLSLFNSTVDELFSGEKAEEAKSRAYSMAVVIQVKLGLV
jgi:hemoglobin